MKKRKFKISMTAPVSLQMILGVDTIEEVFSLPDTPDTYKRLVNDPSINSWEFVEDDKASVTAVWDGIDCIKVPLGDKVAEVDLTSTASAAASPFAEIVRILKEKVDLKDMNAVIEVCLGYLRHVDSCTPLEYLRAYNPESAKEVDSNIWNNLSEGLVKMILVLMSHGTLDFAKTLATGLERVHQGMANSNQTTPGDEQFLQKIFVG